MLFCEYVKEEEFGEYIWSLFHFLQKRENIVFSSEFVLALELKIQFSEVIIIST
jgi:hypothetical protein